MKRFRVSYEYILTDVSVVLAETEDEAIENFYDDTTLEGVQINYIEELETI